MTGEEKNKRQQMAMDGSLNINQLGGKLLASQAAGMQHQESSLRHEMWDDIQSLKRDVQQLQSAFNKINEFLNEVYAND